MFIWLLQSLCGHKRLMRWASDTHGRRGTYCPDCKLFEPYPTELTQATGAYKRIEERISLEERVG